MQIVSLLFFPRKLTHRVYFLGKILFLLEIVWLYMQTVSFSFIFPCILSLLRGLSGSFFLGESIINLSSAEFAQRVLKFKVDLRLACTNNILLFLHRVNRYYRIYQWILTKTLIRNSKNKTCADAQFGHSLSSIKGEFSQGYKYRPTYKENTLLTCVNRLWQTRRKDQGPVVQN